MTPPVRPSRRMLDVRDQLGDEPLPAALRRLYREGGIDYVAGKLGINPKTASRWLEVFGIAKRRWLVPDEGETDTWKLESDVHGATGHG